MPHPSLPPAPFEIPFSLTTANVNEKRLDRVRDGREIDSRVKRLYCFTGTEGDRTSKLGQSKSGTTLDISFARELFREIFEISLWWKF